MNVAAHHSMLHEEAEKITFLDWLQSDGATGVVDTGFVVSNYLTRILITAAIITDQFTAGVPLVCGGTQSVNDLNTRAFGFAAFFTDRQVYIRSGGTQFWNTSANRGNWRDGQFHAIEIGATSGTSATATVDNTSIPMTKVNGTDVSTMPQDSQSIFATKYNNGFYLINKQYKVRRVAFALNGVILADFRAAEVGSNCGFYDIIAGVFHPGAGSFSKGQEIAI